MLQRLGSICWILLFSIVCTAQADAADKVDMSSALIQMAADDIDRAFGDIQSSTEAVAHEYERLYRETDAMIPAERAAWQQRLHKQDGTVQFRSWDDTRSEPAYQSPLPAYYAYGDDAPTEKQYRELAIFLKLTPVVRAAYDSFDFSWTYFTTANGMMLLYPFLTLSEAVNNYPPTQQIFYTRANFAGRKSGWTPPYLDLAGAGMMVTVSCPAFDGDKAIGVASHDITLQQLSARILGRLAANAGDVAYIVDGSGLVIGVSDPALRKELQEANQTAGQAVLHYGTGDGTARYSTVAPWINELTGRLLNETDIALKGSVLHVAADGHSAIAVRTHHPGWIVVLASSSV